MCNKRYHYIAFGLTISSCLEFPELPPAHLAESVPDITIADKDLSTYWSEHAGGNEYFVVKPDQLMFRVPDVAIFLMTNGTEVFVSPLADVVADQIRLYLLGTCMGAILFQRKVLPLHGSAVVVDNKAYAIVGDSGAGKSTLASAMLKCGCRLLSDDVIPVTLSNEGIPMVTPAYPQQKLWLESLHEFKINQEGLRPIVQRETKFALPVLEQFENKQMPLAGVFELMKTDSNKVKLSETNNLERLQKLYYHTYRNFFIKRAGLLEWHFNITANIAGSIEMFLLQRPAEQFTAHELVDVMLTRIKKKEGIL